MLLPSKNNVSFWSKIWGNSKIDTGEQWDDGNSVLGDGWDSKCQIEYGFKCDNSKKPSFCYPHWGDGKRDLAPFYEEWDDSNNLSMDGWDGNCKVEKNYVWDNSTGIDICKTIFTAPIIATNILDIKSFQITLSFDQVMLNQNLTDFDLNLDVIGPNSPYSVSWSASFIKKNIIISFSFTPLLIGGVNEKIILQIINVQRFKSEHDIPMISPQLFSYIVPSLPASASSQAGGSGASYMFIVVMLLSIGVSLITGGSIELMWSLANTLQILFYYGMLNLYYSSELLSAFSYMSYSNFDNPAFDYIRKIASKMTDFIHTSIPSGFENLGFSSASVVINFLDKLIMILLFAWLVLWVSLLYCCLKK